MLRKLYIQHLAIIDSIDIEFQKGLSVFTGETGAGKSIIIDGLNLALGERADTSLIRHDEERCEVVATFDIGSNTAAIDWLKQHSISQQQCVLKRQLNQNGNSRCFVNDKPINQRLMQEIGNLLITIHSQHSQHKLIQAKECCQLLDTFANHKTLLSQVDQFADAYQKLSKQKQQIIEQQGNTEKLALLQYQLQELESFSPQKEEYKQLNEKHHWLANIEQFNQNLQNASQLLSDGEVNILEQMNQLLGQLQEHTSHNQKIQEVYLMLNDAQITIQESYHDLLQLRQDDEAAPENFQQIDQRLRSWHDLARKHHIEPENLFEHFQDLIQQLNDQKNASERLEQITQQQKEITERWYSLAQQLSENRQQASVNISTKTNQQLKNLNIPDSRLIVQVIPVNVHDDKIIPTQGGIDKVDILFSANSDQPPKSLNKVASGGELSRVNLALAVNLAHNSTIPILIFDEVDVGISGATASMVGKLLQQLSHYQQIISITHQAQVATCGHHHLKIFKTVENGQTFTGVTYLELFERIDEIARMIGGIRATATTQKHATELLHQAHQNSVTSS